MDTLTLPYEVRQKSRFKAALDSGDDIGVILPRGTVLKDGDLLGNATNDYVRVIAAMESVSIVETKDAALFARVCYHLGNRHVPLQIAPQATQLWARYLHDHVLDDMVVSLGATIRYDQTPFEPEVGAYHQHAHGQSHSHSHAVHEHD